MRTNFEELVRFNTDSESPDDACDQCLDTGWCGDVGPGWKGNNEVRKCDCDAMKRDRRNIARRMNTTNTQPTGSSDRMTGRPAIGEMVIVHDYTEKPFKARVRDYHQCSIDCIRVTRAHTTEEWIVMWQHCSHNGKVSDAPDSAAPNRESKL